MAEVVVVVKSAASAPPRSTVSPEFKSSFSSETVKEVTAVWFSSGVVEPGAETLGGSTRSVTAIESASVPESAPLSVTLTSIS